MMRRWQWHLRQFLRLLWVRATLFSVLAVLTAFAAVLLDSTIPDDWESMLGASAIDSILEILATSMLTITTFSLTTMVSAYSSATSQVTPRATKLLIADTTTHNVLATFIGTFLYSLVGIIVLSMEAYGGGGRVVLFAVTLCVIGVVVGALLRWIDYLTTLGRVNETTRTVENATREAIKHYVAAPTLGAHPLRHEPDHADDPTLKPIVADTIGYIRHIDMQMLNDLAADAGSHLIIAALPGRFVHNGEPLAYEKGDLRCAKEKVREAFSIDDERTFDQDPLYGFAVLAEIASRALSPGINDPGTAIDVVGRAVRLLALMEGTKKVPEVQFHHLTAPSLSIEECFQHIFIPIGRDGAGMVEVQIRLQKALESLRDMNPALFAEAARAHAHLTFARAKQALTIENDLERVRAAGSVFGI